MNQHTDSRKQNVAQFVANHSAGLPFNAAARGDAAHRIDVPAARRARSVLGESAAASPDSGPPRKKARHCGESSDLLRIMQILIRSISGISELHSRNASPLQACCCSNV